MGAMPAGLRASLTQSGPSGDGFPDGKPLFLTFIPAWHPYMHFPAAMAIMKLLSAALNRREYYKLKFQPWLQVRPYKDHELSSVHSLFEAILSFHKISDCHTMTRQYYSTTGLELTGNFHLITGRSSLFIRMCSF
jgi:hypothetical protein